jgi:hypothetical protein
MFRISIPPLFVPVPTLAVPLLKTGELPDENAGTIHSQQISKKTERPYGGKENNTQE